MIKYVKRAGNKLSLLLKMNKSLIRFGITGVINTFVDFLVFTMLYSVFYIDKSVSQTAGYSFGVINSFIFNKLWTFESSAKLNTAKEAIKFVFVNIFSLGISLVSLSILTVKYNVNVYISKIAIIILTQAVNYWGYRFFVFKVNRIKKQEPEAGI